MKTMSAVFQRFYGMFINIIMPCAGFMNKNSDFDRCFVAFSAMHPNIVQRQVIRIVIGMAPTLASNERKENNKTKMFLWILHVAIYPIVSCCALLAVNAASRLSTSFRFFGYNVAAFDHHRWRLMHRHNWRISCSVRPHWLGATEQLSEMTTKNVRMGHRNWSHKFNWMKPKIASIADADMRQNVVIFSKLCTAASHSIVVSCVAIRWAAHCEHGICYVSAKHCRSPSAPSLCTTQ